MVLEGEWKTPPTSVGSLAGIWIELEGLQWWADWTDLACMESGNPENWWFGFGVENHQTTPSHKSAGS